MFHELGMPTSLALERDEPIAGSSTRIDDSIGHEVGERAEP